MHASVRPSARPSMLACVPAFLPACLPACGEARDIDVTATQTLLNGYRARPRGCACRAVEVRDKEREITTNGGFPKRLDFVSSSAHVRPMQMSTRHRIFFLELTTATLVLN